MKTLTAALALTLPMMECPWGPMPGDTSASGGGPVELTTSDTDSESGQSSGEVVPTSGPATGTGTGTTEPEPSTTSTSGPDPTTGAQICECNCPDGTPEKLVLMCQFYPFEDLSVCDKFLTMIPCSACYNFLTMCLTEGIDLLTCQSGLEFCTLQTTAECTCTLP